MNHDRKNSTISMVIAVFVSTFIALVLTVVQVPAWLFYFWPEWIALVIIYWALATPSSVGPFVGFIIGTLLEVLFVRVFGVLGLGLATLAFIVNSSSRQLRVLSIWQQMISVGLFVAIFKLLTGWLSGLLEASTITSEDWYSIVGSVLIWPFAYILLEELRRALRIR